MKKLLRWGVRGLLGLLLVAGGLLAHTLWLKPLKIEWFYERVFADYAFNSPELLSSLRMLPIWLNWYSDELDDASLPHDETKPTRSKSVVFLTVIRVD